MRVVISDSCTPHPLLFLPGVHENHVRPLGEERVHWTLSCFRLAPRRGGIWSRIPLRGMRYVLHQANG